MKNLLFFFLLFISASQVSAQSCSANFNFSTSNLGVQFSDSSFSTAPISNYFWSFGDGDSSILQNPFHIYSQSGSYQVCLSIVSGNCTDFICRTVNVSGSSTACMSNFNYFSNGLTVQFRDTSTATSKTSYFWDFGDTDSSRQRFPIHTYNNPGAYWVTLSIYDSLNNCSSQFSDSVIVAVPPPACRADFSALVNQDTVFIQNNSVNFTSVSFDFGDNNFSTRTNPVHTYTQSGTYPVCLTVMNTQNNCTDTFCLTVTVTSPPSCTANFVTFIHQDTVYVQDRSSGFTSVTYNFGDNTSSTQTNPVHIYTQSGTYAICQTIVDSATNCTDIFCDSVVVTVPPPCVAGFSTLINQGSVSIQNMASNFNTILYEFGDGTSSSQPNPMHTYNRSATYTICQTVTNSNGCSSQFCDSVIINIPPPCSAGFNVTTNLLEISIQNTAANFSAISYDFGDNTSSSQPNPNHIYQANGFYIICQTVTNQNNCTDIFCDTVNVRRPEPCVADFESTTVNDTTYFTNKATSYNRVVYYFGDGDSSLLNNPVHVYQRSDQYIVSQKVFNDTINCVSIFTDTIHVSVSQSCYARFEIAIDTNNLGTLFLVNTSSKDPSHSYFWNFGDGSTASGRLVSHQYALNQAYKICLTIADSSLNCISTFCDSVGLDSNGGVLKNGGFKLLVVEGSFVGIDESAFTDENLSIYPNPFSDQITIELSDREQEVQFYIIDSQGKVMQENRLLQLRNEISVENLPNGLYYLRLSDGNNSVTKKIIKL